MSDLNIGFNRPDPYPITIKSNNSLDINLDNYRVIDNLIPYYDIPIDEEDINTFISENNDFNQFMNFLLDFPIKFKSFFNKNLKVTLKLTLKLIDGDYFNTHLLGIYIPSNDLSWINMFDYFEDELYDSYDWNILDKVHISLEY